MWVLWKSSQLGEAKMTGATVTAVQTRLGVNKGDEESRFVYLFALHITLSTPLWAQLPFMCLFLFWGAFRFCELTITLIEKYGNRYIYLDGIFDTTANTARTPVYYDSDHGLNLKLWQTACRARKSVSVQSSYILFSSPVYIGRPGFLHR